ncbi:leucine Rich Repeat [Seminavis robusta]|uniref:Leucine Rich Repeat n=1 Tax=Seminavis robusta TaxID=568900 RepID=A0A9N8ETK2_9STRA|nr:leucine Rich Repeat [Seminavis robusta]|eukprot:Sro1912_g304960.1 leucine Rich Repeat (854) ;mRNA; f:1628-4450
MNNSKETNPTKPVACLNTTSSSSGNSGTVDHATLAPPPPPTLDCTLQRLAEERAAKEALRASLGRTGTGTGTGGIVASSIPGPLVNSTDDRKPPPSATTATRGLKRSVEEKAAKDAARRSPGSATVGASDAVDSPCPQRGLKRSEEEKEAKKAARGNNSGATNQAEVTSASSAAMAMVNHTGSKGTAAASAMQPGVQFVPASDTISSTDERSCTTMRGLAKNRKPAVSGQAPAPTSGERSSTTTRGLAKNQNPSVSGQAPATVTENEAGNTQVVQSEIASVGINGEGLGNTIQRQNKCESEAPASIPNSHQPLEIEDNGGDAANMPRASPVDENQTLQHAVPLEQPKAPEGSGRKSPLIFIIVGLLVVIGIIVAGVCGSGHCSSKDSSSEEQELSPRDMDGMEIKAQLEKVLGPTYFDGSTDNTEPHQKALKWIIHQDPRQLPPDSNHLLQRFILTQFYFSTSQASPWKFCGAASGAQTDECEYKIVYNNRVGSERWLSGVSECRWAGCSCSGETDNISSFYIWDNRFTGSLPSELGLLSHARSLSLGKQNFTGTIPSTIYQLTALATLYLLGNNFTGTINPAVFSMPSLIGLDFDSNQMTGTIPTEVGLFQGNLISVSRNFLTGTIPSELFSTQKVRHSWFGDNKLSGTIPTEVGLLSVGVEKAYLDITESGDHESGPTFDFARNNALSGTIPSEFGLVDKLHWFDIQDTSIEGTIPEELILSCLHLEVLSVENCNLGGTLSTNFGLLTNLQYLMLANNNFEGSIPVGFEALTGLKDFTINGNPELRGGIPDGMCLENDRYSLGLFDFVADCAETTLTASDGTTSTGEPLVSCFEGCCSTCCDGGTGICKEQ